MKTRLEDVLSNTPGGIKAVEEAIKKSCEDQVKLLKEAKNKRC